ncbi:cation:proton antiporter family protein [uncultured Methylophaga sp.]|uniref:cation:proton antiporter family protein n=1 Tax=uncultured Methylophaga sp. TaxID=285271 RepID=UPI00260EBB54|nr:cation:proton antiporter family protein [uncultured Methylophaga sp.]
MEPAYFIYAFAGGLLAMILRLPPLAGFLAAGFLLNYSGYELTPTLEAIASLGVTLLLFTIGLKLNIRTLLQAEVWGVASLHITLSSLLFVGILGLLKFGGILLMQSTDWTAVLILAFALSFSSTVFAVKVLEERSETQSFYGRVAIGILIMQDIFAVIFLSATTGTLPSVWALGLFLLIPAAPFLRQLLDRLGHGEMQVLFGFVLALVIGYKLFEMVGLKGDLGALIMGVLLAPHKTSANLARSLFNIKELFLVGFFLSIGLTALPSWEHIGLALLLLVLLPLKTLLFVMMFPRFRLRIRTSVLTSLTLTNYSEFGLIVAALAMSQGWLSNDWLVILSLAVAMSFVISAILNNYNERMYQLSKGLLTEVPTDRLHLHDKPIELNSTQVVILGMGKIGRGAYQRLEQKYGLKVLGVDNDQNKVSRLNEAFWIVEGDAVDSDFWNKLLMSDQIQLVVLAMPHHAGNVYALKQLRGRDFKGHVAAIVEYPDEVERLKNLGADEVFEVYEGAGLSLADQAMQKIEIKD